MAYRILFMGTPDFSVPILRALNLKHTIVSIFTQPPKKKSRGQKLIKSPVHLEAEKLNIPIRFPINLNNDLEFNFIKEINAQFVIVVAYGQIIPKKILDIKNKTFLNIHASLLPKWRGAAPIQRSIMEMDKETGLSIMKIVPELDSGPFMLQKKISINKNDNYNLLSKKLSSLGSELILDALKMFEKNKVKFTNQDKELATYAKKIDKKESKINWNQDSKKIIAMINGLNPSPGAWFKHKGNRIKIRQAIEVKNEGKPGCVLTDNLIIGCKKNSIKIELLQKEGKTVLNTKDFLSGYKISLGEILN